MKGKSESCAECVQAHDSTKLGWRTERVTGRKKKKENADGLEKRKITKPGHVRRERANGERMKNNLQTQGRADRSAVVEVGAEKKEAECRPMLSGSAANYKKCEKASRLFLALTALMLVFPLGTNSVFRPEKVPCCPPLHLEEYWHQPPNDRCTTALECNKVIGSSAFRPTAGAAEAAAAARVLLVNPCGAWSREGTRPFTEASLLVDRPPAGWANPRERLGISPYPSHDRQMRETKDYQELAGSIDRSRKRHLEEGLLRGEQVTDRLRVQEASASPFLKRQRSSEKSPPHGQGMAMTMAEFRDYMEKNTNRRLDDLDDKMTGMRSTISKIDENVKANSEKIGRHDDQIAEICAEVKKMKDGQVPPYQAQVGWWAPFRPQW